jgi:hypothetical protein
MKGKELESVVLTAVKMEEITKVFELLFFRQGLAMFTSVLNF